MIQFLTIATILTALAASLTGASALSLSEADTTKVARDDPHIGDLRLYGAEGCSADNLGVWTVLQSDLGTCFNFTETVKAVYLTDIDNGCSCKSPSGLFL